MNIAFFDHYTMIYRIKGATLYKTNTYQVILGLCQFSNEIRTVTLRNYKQSEETMILHAIYSTKDKT